MGTRRQLMIPFHTRIHSAHTWGIIPKMVFASAPTTEDYYYLYPNQRVAGGSTPSWSKCMESSDYDYLNRTHTKSANVLGFAPGRIKNGSCNTYKFLRGNGTLSTYKFLRGNGTLSMFGAK